VLTLKAPATTVARHTTRGSLPQMDFQPDGSLPGLAQFTLRAIHELLL